MAKIIKDIYVTWDWEGDEYNQEGGLKWQGL